MRSTNFHWSWNGHRFGTLASFYAMLISAARSDARSRGHDMSKAMMDVQGKHRTGVAKCKVCRAQFRVTTDGPQLTGDALTTDCKGAKPWTSQS